MNIEQLRHLLRASAQIVGDDQFIVIGSQSILGKYPNSPAELLWSTEADLIAKNKPRQTDKLESIGELSEFHHTHGIYADPVSEKTAVLAKGWKGRLVNIVAHDTNGETVTGLCLDPHDLFVSKVAAGREKDIEFARSMIEHRMVNRDRVLQLAGAVRNPVDDMHRSFRIASRIDDLYAMGSEHQLPQIDLAHGSIRGALSACPRRWFSK
ncbi:hypothetical protein NHH73_07595 [Oxalobacteraceae bacterium OTU3CINTB1]|nr:hypothetical protein NHH73_07595 [Oxalobacteraceae bacterium OTU3CINTB1]